MKSMTNLAARKALEVANGMTVKLSVLAATMNKAVARPSRLSENTLASQVANGQAKRRPRRSARRKGYVDRESCAKKKVEITRA